MPTTKKTKAADRVTKKTSAIKRRTTNVATKKRAIKDATKKVATKKTPKKKTRSTATVSSPSLARADGEHCFWVCDGQVLHDLDELELALASMVDDVFAHHVTSEKNDFADWVAQVLGDANCAQALRRAQKRTSARAVVVRCLRAANSS